MRVKIINEHVEEEHRYFWEDLDAGYFQEYYVIDEWLKYWIRQYEKVLENTKDKEWTEYKEEIQSGKLSEDDIEKARQYPIEDLYSGNLRKSGTRLAGKCPFHEERTPSFFIFQENRWYCFSCNEGGDAIDFIRKLKDLDFTEAVKRLING